MKYAIKTIFDIGLINKGDSIKLECSGADRVSIVCSSLGRKTSLNINGKIVSVSSESYICIDEKSEAVNLSVVSGHLDIQKCVFFEDNPLSKTSYPNIKNEGLLKSKFVMIGIIV